MNYIMVKRNYDKGCWNKAMVRIAVAKGVITPAEYGEIVGEAYA